MLRRCHLNSGFQEYFILLLPLLFITLSLFYLISYFCVNFCIFYCSVISVISPLLLLIVYCTVCGLLYYQLTLTQAGVVQTLDKYIVSSG